MDMMCSSESLRKSQLWTQCITELIQYFVIMQRGIDLQLHHCTTFFVACNQYGFRQHVEN